MKSVIRIFILVFVLNVWLAPQKASAQVSVNFQVFYDDLSPYGNWVNNQDYGYVWIPNVSPGFTPYSTNGYWVFTDEGWTWVSDYSWGWAPFHYGRWFYERGYGWAWMPDNDWGPGWVSWRRSEGYYGWTPLGPGITVDFGYSDGYRVPNDMWTFVRDRDFGRRDINNYYINSSNNVTIINNSTVINNIYSDRSSNVRFSRGPDRNEVQTRTQTAIVPVSVRETNSPEQKLSRNELQIYRPRMERNIAGKEKPVPTKVANLNELKPVAQSNIENRRQVENQPNRQQPKDQNIDQGIKVQTEKQQRIDPVIKDQPVKQQRVDPIIKDQPVKQQVDPIIKDQPVRQQRVDPIIKDQPLKQQRVDPINKDQPVKQQRVDPIIKDQPVKQQRVDPIIKDQPVKQQRVDPIIKDQPVKERPVRQPRNDQPVKDQPVKQQRNDQPVKQPPVKQQPPVKDQPAKQQPPVREKPVKRSGKV